MLIFVMESVYKIEIMTWFKITRKHFIMGFIFLFYEEKHLDFTVDWTIVSILFPASVLPRMVMKMMMMMNLAEV